MQDNIAFIGIGSNLENPQQQVETAITELSTSNSTSVLRKSNLYKTKPVGPQDQPDFINAVVEISTLFQPLELLDFLQSIEQVHGRVRTSHWGARTLDLDLLLYNDQEINHPRLTVPHPEMIYRAFVLVPLADIQKKISIPGYGELGTLIEHVDKTGVIKIADDERR